MPNTKKANVSDASRPQVPGFLTNHKFTPKEDVFVREYLLHFNGSRAVVEAGYSKAGAAVTAYRLLRKPHIRAEITAQRHARAENIDQIGKDRIQYELASIGLANMADYSPMFGDGDMSEKLANLTRTEAAAVKEIVVEEFRDGRSDWRTVRRTKFKLHDKHAPLELLAKMQGWVQDKVVHDHQHQGLIVHRLMQDVAELSAGRPIVEIEQIPEAI